MNTQQELRNELYLHLTERMLPFWMKLRDEEFGGYYGWMDFDGNIDKKASKGCILNSRILWYFSNAAELLHREDLLEEAKHAYEFLRDYCIDKTYKGVYWSISYDGTPEETIKHTYNQAFAIYALSSYYYASGCEEALHLAQELYDVVESRCTDAQGYLESFARDFALERNEKLSENGVIADRTMNTLLHVLEAYTELYRVSREERVGNRLAEIIELFEKHVYNPEKSRQEVFFDMNWNSIIDLHSYGHDIETSWLMDRACDVLGRADVTERLRVITGVLADKILERAYEEHSVLNECEDGVDDKTRVWWIQAESMVGFYNAWECHGQKPEYLQTVYEIWEYVKQYLLDPREGMEWYWEVDEHHMPTSRRPIVEPWKCPYHNGRMCFELIKRIDSHMN